MKARKLIYNKLKEVIQADSSDDSIGLHHQIVPQGKSFPAIVYQLISKNTEYCQGATTRKLYRFQIDVYHKSDARASAIAEAIFKSLNLFIGNFEGENYQFTTSENESERYDHSLDLHIISQDFIVRQN